MGTLLLALGLVFVIEGLVFALAPSRVEDALRAIAAIPPERRRLLGLAAVACGVLLVWIARGLGA
jgi:uncharacterized protein YjeT (DUF2065 family)